MKNNIKTILNMYNKIIPNELAYLPQQQHLFLMDAKRPYIDKK